MSICYRTDGRKTTVRGNAKGPPPAAATKKLPSLQSTVSSKRKSHSISSASTHSSLRSTDSEKEKSPCRPGIKPKPSHEQDKENAIPDNVKAKNLSLIEIKRREFLHFRKQLMQQQNTYIDMYAQLRDMEDRSGIPPGSAGEVRLLSITDWPVHDLLLLMPQNKPAQPQAEIKGVLGPKILQQLSSQLSGIPEEVMALATELMARRLELLKFIRSILSNENRVLAYDGKNIDWQAKNVEFDEETKKVHKLVCKTVKSFEAKIIHSLDVAKIPWIDRDNMIKKIESLQKELSIYKNNKPDDSVKPSTDSKLPQKVQDELSKERAARAAMKELVTAAETKAASARARCSELERQLNDTRVELASAQRRLDNLKQLHHYRASNYESHSKKLEKVSKTGEVTIEVLSRQRDALELRVRELQEQATAKLREADARENQLTCRIESLRAKLEEQVPTLLASNSMASETSDLMFKEQKKDLLEAQVQEADKRLKELQEQFNALQERSRELVILQHQKCVEYLPRKVQCSGEELEIWNDLQATKDALGRVKEELELSRADKDGLLTSLAKIAHEGPENKMAEELLSREQQITRMRNNIKELTENKRKMEESMACYENQLAALRLEVNLLRNLNTYETYNQELPHEELQTEVFNLCLQVESLTRERAALMTEAATRALLLERHERGAELFAQVTRARRELAAQLEGNTAQSVFEGAKLEVVNSLSKAYLTGADTWSALRAERSRVVRLENTILAQSRALDRDSVVRLQHERRRAQLERELIRTWAGSAGSIKRERDSKEAEIAELLY